MPCCLLPQHNGYTMDFASISYSERSGSSTPPLNSYIPLRISERRYFTHLNRHQHQSYNTLHYIHIDNTVYSASFVPTTVSSRWEARDGNTSKPIPVRIRPLRYTGHALKQKPTRNKRNHNLIVVPRTPMASGFKPGKFIEFCLLNSRSIKNKASLLNDFVIENKVDVMVITETWLPPGDVDQAVKTVTPQGYVLRCVSREQRGGGVAVVCKKSLLAKVSPAKCFKSFEYMDTLLKSCSKLLRLVVVYRPPPSNKNKTTNELFRRVWIYARATGY